MPDLFTIVFRWWKFIVLTTVAATAIALVASLLSSKKYLSTATALPANSLLADKARLFNTNIESLYSELGTVDELDKIEGTATLDTIYIATVNELNLVDHYGIEANGEAAYKAALRLKKETNINKSAYGELKIKAWDKDQNLAAQIANSLLQNIQQLHQNVQVSHTRALIEKIKDEYSNKQKEYIQLFDSLNKTSGATAELLTIQKATLAQQLQQYETLIEQNELALKTNPPVLLVVERARPAVYHDKPKVLQLAAFTFFGSLVSAILLAVYLESRKRANGSLPQ